MPNHPPNGKGYQPPKNKQAILTWKKASVAPLMRCPMGRIFRSPYSRNPGRCASLLPCPGSVQSPQSGHRFGKPDAQEHGATRRSPRRRWLRRYQMAEHVRRTICRKHARKRPQAPGDVYPRATMRYRCESLLPSLPSRIALVAAGCPSRSEPPHSVRRASTLKRYWYR